MTRTLMYQGCVLPDRWFRLQHAETKRIVIYAHGEINKAGSMRGRGRWDATSPATIAIHYFWCGKRGSGIIGDVFSDHFAGNPSRAGGVRH